MTIDRNHDDDDDDEEEEEVEKRMILIIERSRPCHKSWYHQLRSKEGRTCMGACASYSTIS